MFFPQRRDAAKRLSTSSLRLCDFAGKFFKNLKVAPQAGNVLQLTLFSK
jgi:hypothetical protein